MTRPGTMENAFQGRKILIIDDDITICQAVEIVFSLEGAFVYTAADGRQGLHQFFAHRPDLVILDVKMPDMDGCETCRQIRLLSNTPIIMLTTMNRDEDMVRGLDAGADDFISKPFSSDVLLARARAVLRRSQWPLSPEQPASYQDEYLSIDLAKRDIIVQGKLVKLTATEFQLLSYLLQNAGRVLTYQQILENVWGWEYKESIDYVHVYVSHLRRKLEKDPKSPRYLQTEHGVGYRFQKQ